MKKILFNALLMTAGVLGANAQWSGNSLTGTAIEAAVTTKNPLASASDGAGGAFVAWVENATTVKVQRVGADGTLKFGSAVTVSNATGLVSSNKTSLTIASDGLLGAILVWQDERNRVSAGTAKDEIFGQRINATGVAQWTPATAPDGIRLTVADASVSSKIVPIIQVVSATEAVVVFGDNRSGTTDLFAQKILISTGATQWTVSGSPADLSVHGALGNNQTTANADAIADGSGGLFLVWHDPRVSTADNNIYAQHIDNGGSLLWGANGTAVCTLSGSNQNAPRLTSDGSGGIVATWLDLRTSASDVNIFAQRLNAAGTPQWTVDGIAVCLASGNQNNPMIVNSGSNYIISWADNRVSVSDRNIYAQSIDGTGSVLWAANGVAITQAIGNQPTTISGSSTTQSMLPDGANGAVIFWDDARNGGSNLDIYAQRINSSGVVQWTADGVPVSTAANNQAAPVAVPGPTAGSFVIAWRDSRSGTANGQVYAARLQPNGVLPVRSVSLNAVAKATSIDVKWTTVDESNTSSFVVEKSSNGIAFATIGSAMAIGAGNGAYSIEDSRPSKGLNYYRIKSVDLNKDYSYSATAAVQFGGAVKAALVVYPNPVAQTATVQLSNVEKGAYQILVHDFAGRVVLQKAVSVNADYSQVQLPLSGFAPGNYLLHLSNAKGTVMSLPLQKQ